MIESVMVAALSNQVVAAATGDAWDLVRARLVRLLGGGHPERELLTAEGLDETRQQLTESDSAHARSVQAKRLEFRLAELLDTYPGAELDIIALINEMRAQALAAPEPVPTGPDITRKAKIFISYSHRDDRYREQLVTHLAGLRRQGVIADWHDRKIVPGDEWRDAIDQNLDASDCVLLLVSSDFLASDYCYSVEMQRTLEKHRQGRVLVIPVIVRPADWQHSPLSGLEALPRDAKPVVEWSHRDRAWLDVAEGLRRALDAPRG